MIPFPGPTEDIIHQALTDAFENLVFEEVVLAGVIQDHIPDIYLDGWWARIQMISPLPWGHITILVPNNLMNRFTEAILGLMNEPPNEEQNIDNLGELLNTLCGRLMSLRSSPDRTFRIGLPEVGHGMAPEMSGPYRCIDCLVGEDHVYLLAPEAFWDDVIWQLDLNNC